MKTFYLIYLLGLFLPSNAKRIVNGEDAVLGQFPYQVLWAIAHRDSVDDFYVHCGGSIYNKSTIITAAHCCAHFDHYPIPLNKTTSTKGISSIKPEMGILIIYSY